MVRRSKQPYMPEESRTKIKIISKAVAVLWAISLGSSRLSNIARDVNLSKNQVFRILHSWMDEGIVIQDPVTREYFMGPRLFEITSNPLKTHENLINAAYLEMDALKQSTGETVCLDIKFGMEKIILRQLVGTHQLTFIGKTNPLAHLWEGSVGKVLLAQLDEPEVESILESMMPASDAPSGSTGTPVFRREIEEVKKLGYAASFGEIEKGVASLAAPVAGYIVPASLTLIGSEERMTSRLEEYIGKLISAAAEISRKLLISQQPRR